MVTYDILRELILREMCFLLRKFGKVEKTR
nr:MAG TPA_asm: hypothetical protein [Caudoviricetes sp.]